MKADWIHILHLLCIPTQVSFLSTQERSLPMLKYRTPNWSPLKLTHTHWVSCRKLMCSDYIMVILELSMLFSNVHTSCKCCVHLRIKLSASVSVGFNGLSFLYQGLDLILKTPAELSPILRYIFMIFYLNLPFHYKIFLSKLDINIFIWI